MSTEQKSVIDAYERVLIQEVRNNRLFLYVLHVSDSNHLQIGFGMESVSGLNKAHIPGPNIHELHGQNFVAWLRDGGQIVFTEDRAPRIHPFSSTPNEDGDMEFVAMLQRTSRMALSAGRFMPLVLDPFVWPKTAGRFADAVLKVQYEVFGNPLDWDVERVDLSDGRFVWQAYDEDIDKIRLGLGFYDDANDPQFGSHTYAVALKDAAGFAAFHFNYIDAPLQFMGLPARWPFRLTNFVTGKGKQNFAVKFLGLADRVWPGRALEG